MRFFAPFLLALSFALPFISSAAAHTKSLSFSQILWQGRVAEVQFTVPARDVTLLPSAARMPSLGAALGPHLDTHIRVQQITAPCAQQAPFESRPAQRGYVKMTARYVCPSDAANLTLSIDAFFNLAGGHVHFARILNAANDMGGTELLFTANRRAFTLSTDRDGTPILRHRFVQSFNNYFRHGVVHILSGLDHLAFLACLILLAPGTRRLLLAVTGFTLGHSLTLALAALKWVNPESAVVEAIIGGSIAVLAAESVLAKRGSMPMVGVGAVIVLFAMAGLSVWLGGPIPLSGWVGMMVFCAAYGALIRAGEDSHRMLFIITFAFGLFHGAGFGGLLVSIGLPQGQVFAGLLGFNLGVEVGQIAVLSAALVVALLWAKLLSKRMTRVKLTPKPITAAVLVGYGVFLFTTRALF